MKLAAGLPSFSRIGGSEFSDPYKVELEVSLLQLCSLSMQAATLNISIVRPTYNSTSLDEAKTRAKT